VELRFGKAGLISRIKAEKPGVNDEIYGILPKARNEHMI
jgi:hypothetical protein